MLEGSILKLLDDQHRQGTEGKRPLNFGVYYKNTLVALCHALEDSILGSDGEPVVITAFQQGKWYLQEADRYGDIAGKAQQIVIMAMPDAGFAEHSTSQKPNVSLLGLNSDDPVAQEWHLIIVSPEYTAMVLCQELSDADYGAQGIPKTDLERKFYGFWTFEPRLVLETAELAIAKIGDYDTTLQQQLSDRLASTGHAIQTGNAACSVPVAEHLSDIVLRVVDYLKVYGGEDAYNDSSAFVDPVHGSRKLNTNLLSNELQAFLRVAQLMDQADINNPMAGAEVAALAEALGQLLDLPGWQLHRLRLAGILHRLAFLNSTEGILNPQISSRPAAEVPSLDADVPPSCPLILGTQVLRTMPRLRAIATIISHQSEWWNGTGKPAHLSGDEIPLESRILGLSACLQGHLARLHPMSNPGDRFSGELQPEILQSALAECAAQAGERWDPKLVDVLTLLVSGLSQGLNLSVSVPKIAAGLWMTDSRFEEEGALSTTP
ncbi:MAG: DICT sensory domain-containing protein [Elainellaceae cyanobacterium]